MGKKLSRTVSGGPVEIGVVTAVGIWFYAIDTQRYLYLLRNDPRHPGTWGLPGGKVDAGETLIQAMERECSEEIGAMPEYTKIAPIEKFTSADGGFIYHTFFCTVTQEFRPVLNEEHSGWAWIASGQWPRPMHPGLWSTVNFEVVQNKITVMEQSV
jgi:8-oxo-dGTP pyrophosphatase MutT (NUDIX family)